MEYRPAIIIIVGIVAVWRDFALAGGILSINIGAWVIILEGWVFGLAPAMSTLFFLGGVVSIWAGGFQDNPTIEEYKSISMKLFF